MSRYPRRLHLYGEPGRTLCGESALRRACVRTWPEQKENERHHRCAICCYYLDIAHRREGAL